VPSAQHEILIELIRVRPAVLALIAHPRLSLDVRAKPVIAEASVSDLKPAEHSADLVLHYPDRLRPHGPSPRWSAMTARTFSCA